MEKVRVCLIGCGRAGMIHARAYNSQVVGAELIAICDPFDESLRSAQQELNVKYTYTDYHDVMKNEEIDAVVVVTPTKLHKEIVVAAANAHKNVFCEKPMAESKQECEEMIEACKINNVKLQVGFMRRIDTSLVALLKLTLVALIQYANAPSPIVSVIGAISMLESFV